MQRDNEENATRDFLKAKKLTWSQPEQRNVWKLYWKYWIIELYLAVVIIQICAWSSTRVSVKKWKREMWEHLNLLSSRQNKCMPEPPLLCFILIFHLLQEALLSEHLPVTAGPVWRLHAPLENTDLMFAGPFFVCRCVHCNRHPTTIYWSTSPSPCSWISEGSAYHHLDGSGWVFVPRHLEDHSLLPSAAQVRLEIPSLLCRLRFT